MRSSDSRAELRSLPFPIATIVLQLAVAVWAALPAGGECRVEQVTQGTAADLPPMVITVDEPGNRVVLAWRAEIVAGRNPDLNTEVFLWEAGTGWSQLTDTTGITNFDPRLSPDGCCVTFSSDADLVPGSNPDGNRELFLYRIDAGRLEQLTDTVDATNGAPSPSAGAERIGFVSNADFTGHNPDGNTELFRLDTATGLVAQITSTAGSGSITSRPGLSGDGEAIVFASPLDLVPGHNLDGNREIFLHRDDQPLAQITESVGGSNEAPDIDDAGDRVVFRSDADLGVEAEEVADDEIFLWDAVSGLRRIASPGSVSPPVIDHAGRRMAMVELADASYPGDRLLVHDGVTGRLREIVRAPVNRFIYPVGISGSGLRTVISSDGDLTGANSRHEWQIFVVDCGLFADGFETGDTSRWTRTVN